MDAPIRQFCYRITQTVTANTVFGDEKGTGSG
jgi:hypothetical protein